MSLTTKNHSNHKDGQRNVSGNSGPDLPVDQIKKDDTSDTPSDQSLVIDDLKKQMEQLNDKLLRVAAEAENEKKRAAKDAEERVRFAIAGFAMDLTDSIDVLFLSTSSIDDNSLQQNPSLKAFYDGIEMIRKSFMETLEKHGVNRIDPMGLQFDHNYHQAIVHAPHESSSGTIIQVMKAGYTLNGRPLKHAMVVVSSGEEVAATNGV